MTRRSISSIIAERARSAPAEVVVVDERGRLTAAELDDAATRLAHELRRRGVATDDLVTVSLPNGRDFVVATAAVWRAGATPQPVAVALTDEERAAVERVARPAAAIGRAPHDPAIPWIESVDAPAATDPLPDLAAASWKAPTTSGSTGRPKVVQANAPAMLDPTRPVADFLPLVATQLVAGPLTHSATFTYAFRGLLTGHRLVILDRFDERAWLDAVERHGVTWALVVPTMMHRLLRLPEAERDPGRLRSVEALLHMGAPCSVPLKRAFLAWAGAERVIEVYAGSESNGLTMIRGDEWLMRPGSVGRPIGGTEIQIRTPTGEPSPIGTEGQVWMRRGSSPAYVYRGALSQRDPDGWDTLSDVGRLDDDGYLYLVDRTDDVINRGGDKIYPVEIERVIEQHPAVRSVLAFGRPDDALGERIAAVVDVAGSAVTPDELIAWSRERLGSRAPVDVRVVHDPVRDDAGKASRRRWSERLEG